MNGTTARVRLLLAEHGVTVAVVLAIAGVVLVGVGAAATADGGGTVTVHEHQQSVGATLSPSATATGDAGLYPAGQELADTRVFVRAATTDLTVTQTVSVPADTSVTVVQDLHIEYRATHEGDVFWQRTEPLANRSATVTDGEATLEAAVNVSAVAAREREAQRTVGTAGEVQTRVVGTVSYDTGRYSDTVRHDLSLDVTESAATFGGEGAVEAHHSTPVERPIGGDDGGAIVAAAIGVLCLVGAGGTWHYDRDEDALEDLRHEAVRARHDEWISPGEVPVWGPERTVRMESLDALVDLAIDTDSRVVEDPRIDAFAVLDGDVVYYYHPAEVPLEALPLAGGDEEWMEPIPAMDMDVEPPSPGGPGGPGGGGDQPAVGRTDGGTPSGDEPRPDGEGSAADGDGSDGDGGADDSSSGYRWLN